MAKLTLKDASAITGIDEARIWKQMTRGWLMASKNSSGEWVIDEDELFRWFPPRELKADEEVKPHRVEEPLDLPAPIEEDPWIETEISRSAPEHPSLTEHQSPVVDDGRPHSQTMPSRPRHLVVPVASHLAIFIVGVLVAEPMRNLAHWILRIIFQALEKVGP